MPISNENDTQGNGKKQKESQQTILLAGAARAYFQPTKYWLHVEVEDHPRERTYLKVIRPSSHKVHNINAQQ